MWQIVILLQTCGRFRLRRSRSCSGWAVVHKEPSSLASSALRRWPSRRCESRRRQTSNTCESSSTQISSVSSMSATPSSSIFLHCIFYCVTCWSSRVQAAFASCPAKVILCVLSNAGACARRHLVTASSWSTVHRANCMRCWGPGGRWRPGCW